MTSGVERRDTGVQDYQATANAAVGNGEGRSAAEESFWRSLVSNNFGLSLVIASELFFAFMHLAVKILNGIDPPVSMAEVSCKAIRILYSSSDDSNFRAVDSGQDGGHILLQPRLYVRDWSAGSFPRSEGRPTLVVLQRNWRVSLYS